MDKRIENFGFPGSGKLPLNASEILSREPDKGSLDDAQKMIGNVDLDIFYPSGIPMKNELLEREKEKKMADLLKYIGNLTDKAVERLKKQD